MLHHVARDQALPGRETALQNALAQPPDDVIDRLAAPLIERNIEWLQIIHGQESCLPLAAGGVDDYPVKP